MSEPTQNPAPAPGSQVSGVLIKGLRDCPPRSADELMIKLAKAAFVCGLPLPSEPVVAMRIRDSHRVALAVELGLDPDYSTNPLLGSRDQVELRNILIRIKTAMESKLARDNQAINLFNAINANSTEI